MPARHRLKIYLSDTYYHVYNRGVEKRPIFIDDTDYAILLSYLKTYLLPKDEQTLLTTIGNATASWKERDRALKLLRLNNFSGNIRLLSYCLMPNHYHMLIWQKPEMGMDEFMNSLWTRYTMYFNKKYHRVGPLFQSVYKAVQVQNEEQLLYLTRYIHRNPIAKRSLRKPASQGLALRSYPWSSYPDYLGVRKTEWINTTTILSYWKSDQNHAYESFILDADEEQSAKIVAPIMI
jgi:putative transposase